MPPRYPPYQTCHRRFQQWADDGTFRQLLVALREDLRQRGKVDVVEAFVQDLPPNPIGDKAFDSGPLSQRLRDERDIELIAPRRSSRGGRRKQDGRRLRQYKRRWKVERLFAWLKCFRRLSTRWERKASNFLGFLHLGCVVVLLRQF